MRRSDVVAFQSIGFALVGYAARVTGDWIAAIFFLGTAALLLFVSIVCKEEK